MAEASGHLGRVLAGKYRLESLLAQGGMGLVYAATNEATGGAVAVKLLRSELVTRPDLVRRVSVEARLAVEASHHNVVQVIDAGTDGESPYLVMERLYGSSLDAVSGDDGLSLYQAVQALMPVVNALVSLHASGIVHRDIKPSNIFLSRDAEGRVTPKLLDFGIAKVLQGVGWTASGVALGTPAYMAPEQALGSGAVGPAADLWSLAVVFVRSLTGRFPYEGQATRRVGMLRSGLRAEDLPAIAPPVAQALVDALRPEPTERLASMQAFRGRLISALRQVDPNRDWPSESTVSYARGESELLDLLQPPPDRSGEVPAGRRGRAEGLPTQTLSAVEARASLARRVLALHLSLLAVASLAALLIGVRAASSPPERKAPTLVVAEQALHASPPEALPQPRRAEPRGAALDRSTTSDAAAVALPVVGLGRVEAPLRGPRGAPPGGRTAAATVRSPPRPSTPSPPPGRERASTRVPTSHDEAPEASDPELPGAPGSNALEGRAASASEASVTDEASPPLGANRAPIID